MEIAAIVEATEVAKEVKVAKVAKVVGKNNIP